MKLTRHNGRSGKHGTYNPKHNDRTFDVSNSEHIDEERAKHNVYWDCFNGYRTFAEKQVQSELQSPERKAPKKERDYAISRLDGVIGKIKNAMQSALQKIQSRLLSPEVKKTSKEQIKEKVKPSILARLERNKELAKQENEARRSEHRPHKKQNTFIRCGQKQWRSTEAETSSCGLARQ